MVVKYKVKKADASDAPGCWCENGRITLDVKHLTNEQINKLDKAIRGALRLS